MLAVGALACVVNAQDAHLDASHVATSLEDAVAPEARKLLRDAGSVVPRDGVLNLRVGDVDVAGLVNVLAAARDGSLIWPDADGRTRPHVLVTRGVLTPAQRAQLETLNLRRMGYLPSNAWIVDVSATTKADVEALSRLAHVVALTPYLDAWKVDPWLRAGAHARIWQTEARRALAARDAAMGGRVAAIVHAFDNQPLDSVLTSLNTIAGVEVYSSERVAGNWTVSISLPFSSVDTLAGLPPVQFAEMTPEYTQRSNSTTRWVVQSNTQGQTPLHARGLLGQGQIVGFMDFGMAWEHCSLSDSSNPIGPLHRKIAAYNAPLTYDLHGTHVAGTLLGDAGTTGNTRGIAYQAKIVFNKTPTVDEASHLSRYVLHASQGAFIHSNSWGADFFTEYDGAARAIDAFSWDHDDALICFSVSNQSLLGNPENAKNSLAVSLTANAPNQNDMPCGGASGPTIDGRRKPELVAPGCSITSAAGSSSGSCGTTTRTGTSMAQPAVAAIGTLVRQYFVDGFYPTGAATPGDSMVPSGALLKAVLAASGQNLSSVPGYPNMREGFGRVLADAALFFAGDSANLVVKQAFNQSAYALDHGDVASYLIEVDDDHDELRIMLAWHDAPATIGTTFAPVNNLDLVVTSPDGKTFFGNAFDDAGLSRSADQGATPDLINNLEALVVNEPARGIWTVQIIATGVNVPGQGFGLAMVGDIQEISVGCIADFDGDGGVTGNDISAFIACYEMGLPEADVDLSGGIDATDLGQFFARFEAGC